MLSVYEKVNTLDKRALEEFNLSEDILMENAAMALERAVFAKRFFRR